MTGDILATIDGALDDYATSVDAMRWRPEDERAEAEPTPHLPRFREGSPRQRYPASRGPSPRWVLADETADFGPSADTEPWVHWPAPDAGEYRPISVFADDPPSPAPLPLNLGDTVAVAGVDHTAVGTVTSVGDDGSFTLTIDTSQFTRGMRQAASAIEQMGGILQAGRAILDGLVEGLSDTSKPATPASSWLPTVPRYRDDRPRWQSPYGPARRR